MAFAKSSVITEERKSITSMTSYTVLIYQYVVIIPTIIELDDGEMHGPCEFPSHWSNVFPSFQINVS